MTGPRTRLAQLIAQQEGYGRPGKIPTVRNNPGDLRHSPHSSHEGIGPNDIGIIDTIEHGWEDLERQLELYAARWLTIQEMVWQDYAPPTDHNDSAAYVAFLCRGLGMAPTALVSAVLKIPAVQPAGGDGPAAA